MATPEEGERAPLLSRQAGASDGHGGSRPLESLKGDDLDFDARFRKWKAAVARKFRGKANRNTKPTLLITQFDGPGLAQAVLDDKRAAARKNDSHEATSMSSQEFQRQVEQVKHAIKCGVYPKMITTGSSGSYFVRVIDEPASQPQSEASSAQPSSLTTVAVFKPKDEEPYGNLNPKRQFARKYLWWAMGRPCLIPNFSYLSEVGASYLDARLALRMVPRTELVEISSPSFHYAYNDRLAFDRDRVPLPDKIGSYQTFLRGYVNASDFLRRHPWPSRARSRTLLMRDMDDESRAHKVSRKKERARLRNCGVAIKRSLLCRPSWDDLYDQDGPDLCHPSLARDSPVDGQDALPDQPDGFYWTPNRMEQFRLQLEKLVVLDFLMRNTDRGLDNFMIKHDTERDEIKIGAIDNSLSFPIKHPNEIRQYPFGWLFLPSDLIGLPFSDATREQLLPILNDPVWWQRTAQGLRKIFQQDPYFDESKFERQMSVMRGQGWNLVQSLQDPDEGPLDLCAREKKLIRQEVQEYPIDKLEKLQGLKLPLDSNAQVLPVLDASRSPGFPIQATSKPAISRTISSGVVERERRPIGMRASESYKKALLRASGAQVTLDSEEELVEEGEAAVSTGVSSSLPHTSTFEDNMQAEASSEEVHTGSRELVRPQTVRHQRFASVQDVGSFSRRQRDIAAGSSRQTDVNHDSVLGRTGIEVLEGLDRERKQSKKLTFFRNRKRSSTISNGDAANLAQTKRPSAKQRQSSEDANRSENDRTYDLASSIVSDPGARIDGASRWPRSRSASRPAEGMYGSLYDLHSQGEVLSEEEEEDDDEDRERQRKVPSTRTVIRTKRGEGVPTIESVLRQGSAGGGSSSDTGNDNVTNGKAFTPHIPHPITVRPSVENSNRGDSAEPTSDPSKGTVKVIVEKMSSDTKQAWLKWI
ncbi:Phosphatidylinositol 4-kinase LSB6 [Pseudozyma hubeiensis]|nr:Phosphatidylinositol 4-kinase LSB6 [Pseudozyma hubeiensis]